MDSDSESSKEEVKTIDKSTLLYLGETGPDAIEVIINDAEINPSDDYFGKDNEDYNSTTADSNITPPKANNKKGANSPRKENEFRPFIAIEQEIALPLMSSEFDEPLPQFDLDPSLKKYTCDITKLLLQNPYLNLFSKELHRGMLFKLSNLPTMDQFKGCKKKADPYDLLHEGYFCKRIGIKV
jgi:hypothetical protein